MNNPRLILGLDISTACIGVSLVLDEGNGEKPKIVLLTHISPNTKKKAKGFDAYITTETRASGTTYFIVLVREDKTGNVADRLRSSGYDCYGVE